MNAYRTQQRWQVALVLICLFILTQTVNGLAQSEPLGVRRNFLGMHNLKGGGVTPFQTGLDWTQTLVNDGFAMEWVTDYAPDAPDHWIYEAMVRGLVPVVRVQQCQKSGNPDCGPSVGYSVNVAAQILDWKVAHPEYADRLVYMQLWNEPGDSRDYVPMDQFADFMVAAYSGIRKIEREYAQAYPSLDLAGTILVLTPGQNDGWDTAFNHNPQAKFAFDVWGTHPYPDLTPPWYNIHDGDMPPGWMQTIDSYILDLNEVARTHHGVPGRRGFPVIITETCYGYFTGYSTVGWPKLTQEARVPYTVDAFFKRWYQWPEILGVNPFLLNNVKWPGFEFVHSWTSQDVEYPFGVLEPANPYPVYTALKEARQEFQDQGLLAPARLTPYRGPVGKITGFVARSDNGDPVPYATIYTDGYEFGHLTLYDGIYEIHDVPVGTYTLSFQKASHLPASREITVAEGQTTVADFSVTFSGKVQETLYVVRDRDGACDASCANQNAVDHWQAFMTGSDTGFIKYAASHVHGDDVTLKFTIHEGGPGGPQVGPAMYAHNPARAGDQMIGWEWPDGQEPAVQPNTMYWLHFQREDGQPIYCYASNQNPYPNGDSSSSSGVDFYGTIYGLTREVNLVTGAIEGLVTDINDNPIEGAAVSISPGGISTSTADDGSYMLTDIGVGTYSMTVSKNGYRSSTVTDLTVVESITTMVDFSLDVLPPTIALSTSSLNPTAQEGSDAAGDSFTVKNTGGDMLQYAISAAASWLSVNPANGTSAAEADTISVSYNTAGLAAGTYSAKITVSDPNATNHPQTVNVVLTVNAVSSGTIAAEDFTSLPGWSSSYDAAWGSPAAWSVVGGGQSGNALQAVRSSGGSSAKAAVYDIEPNTDYTISVYLRCPAWSSNYWAELAYRLGNYPAQDFDSNAGAWSMIQKFSNSTTNGNGNSWTKYSATFNSGSYNRISVGFKLGSTGSGPTVQWDTLRMTAEGATRTPAISVSTASLTAATNEGVNPANQTFTVTNSGDGTLRYNISGSIPWLSLSPANGTSTDQSDIITVSYLTAGLLHGTYSGIITVSDPQATNNPQTIAVALTVNRIVNAVVAEDFAAMPDWTYTYNAGWGSAAVWSLVGSGQSGNALQASRSSAGSSSKVKVFDISPNTDYTISVYIRCPSWSSNYWAECAYRPGNHSAQDFDNKAGAWSLIKKFSSSSANGNDNTWTKYLRTFNSGANTQISIGFKLGSSASAPTVAWDTLRIE